MIKMEQEKNIAKIIKDKVNIVDIVKEQVVLKRSGSKYKGLSPFNEEKTASFFVNPEKQMFYCFSSNKGGDAIDFIMQTKGLSFKETIVWLANKKNISLPSLPFQKSFSINSKKEGKRLLKLNRYAAHFFQTELQKKEGKKAQEYIQKREIPIQIQIDFVLGFAPDSFTALRNYLISKKAPLKDALHLGLLKVKSGEEARKDGANLYDAFRNRIIFPIRDSMGDIVAFGGRSLKEKERSKYLNSPESLLYKKREVLYNLDRAKKHFREKNEALFVEGYTDCLALEKAGFPHVVATLGTALSTSQVKALCSNAQRVIGLYDGDAAGKMATLRNMEIFLEEEGYPLTGVSFPEGQDPDDFLRQKGAKKELQKLLRAAPTVLDTWIEDILHKAPYSKQGRLEALGKIAEKLSLLRDPSWIEARIPDLAEQVSVKETVLRNAILRMQKKKSQKKQKSPLSLTKSEENIVESKHFNAQSDRTKTECQLLDLLLEYESKREEARKLHKECQKEILELIKDENIRSLVRGIAQPLQEGESDAKRMEELLNKLDPNRHPKWRAVLARSLVSAEKKQVPGASFEEILRHIQKQELKAKKKSIRKKIQAAVAKGDNALGDKLLLDLKELEAPKKMLETIDA